ncbi:spore germination protein [Paenibacillus sp. HWE-109]|uniref:GerAB/ArcD/ProY family transporter n=1 Tax=Paenibacillus sp. HWE-109 TaxID=1306526 RepID=UPI001EDF2050|nr:endospore germination permease [Paenibacillus sp. HWE-109]UKS23840.1 spore germination protein [Paenibacillus sp. HWE-109]
MEQSKLTVWQFFVLTLSFLIGTSFFFLPGGLIAAAKQDAWMVPLWGGAAGILISFLWFYLAGQYPGLTIVQICTAAAGKGFGGLLALMYVAYFTQLASFITRNLSDFMKQTLMPLTPLTVFHAMFLLIIAYAVIKGIETIARSTELLFPIVTMTFIFVFIFALSEWNWDRFQGMFRMDVWKTVKDTRSIFGFPFMEALIFLMLFPYVQARRKTTFILAITVATILLSATTFFTIGVLGVSRASHDAYPMFVIVQEIHVGLFFEHLESTVALILLAAIFIKLSIAYYCAVAGLCQLFQITSRSWLALAFILLISGLALGYDNMVENIEFSKKHDFEYSLFFSFIIPVLLLLITWMRRRKKEKKEEPCST